MLFVLLRYRSTHRIWYFFGDGLKANTDCLQTWIGQRGLADNKGVAAIRSPEFSPLCDKATAEFASDYVVAKKLEDFSWNKYPLDLHNTLAGDFLLLSALPGQKVDATFTAYQKGVSVELKSKAGGPIDQETLCGCIDYTVILPSTCKITMALTIDHSKTTPGSTEPLKVNGFPLEAFLDHAAPYARKADLATQQTGLANADIADKEDWEAKVAAAKAAVDAASLTLAEYTSADTYMRSLPPLQLCNGGENSTLCT